MIIGITGGIGSGKSVISKELRRMGYEVYDTDSEAKRLIVENVQIRRNIEDLLGKEVYKDNVYQTQIVASKVFANKSLLVQLNAIVHPVVREDILSRTQDFINNTTSLYFIECAILYTAHLDDICDKVVAITAPEAIRLERTIARDSSGKDEVRARMRMQDVEHDIQRADIIINNDGSTPVSTLCKELLELATKIEHL